MVRRQRLRRRLEGHLDQRGLRPLRQWLWSEKEGEGTAQELADYVYASHPADDAFWTVKPGDPGPENQFHIAVYDRGALALQALRNEIGDEDFFAILKGWPTKYAPRQRDGRRLREVRREGLGASRWPALFDTWLFQPVKPGRRRRPGVRSRSGGTSLPRRPKSWKKIAATNSVHEHARGH